LAGLARRRYQRGWRGTLWFVCKGGDWPLPKIDVRGVDAHRIYKLEESEDRRRRLAEGRPRTDALGRPRRPLSASSINKTIDVLRWLLSFAVEYGWIEANPAVGRRRRLKVGMVDRRPPSRRRGSPRHELAALRWGDLDFAGLFIQVRRSKTPAGIREVKMLPALRGQLLRHRDRRGRPGARELVFKTRRGGVRTKDNVRLRILAPVLVGAGQLLEARGLASLLPGIGPHSLRHTSPRCSSRSAKTRSR
jgi:integrase